MRSAARLSRSASATEVPPNFMTIVDAIARASVARGPKIAAVADALHTPLCDLLGIELPIVLAPMAGGWSPPELAAAVSAAGGLGVLGVTGTTPEATAEAVAEAGRLAGGRPIGINVQIAPPAAGMGTRDALRKHMAPLRRELELPEEGPAPPPADPPPTPAELVAAGLAAGARVVGTALGGPGPPGGQGRPPGGAPAAAGFCV